VAERDVESADWGPLMRLPLADNRFPRRVRFCAADSALAKLVTVEDPNVFTKPWIQDPKKLIIDNDPADAYTEEPPCVEKDASHLVTHDHN
jgi:hypothetical protein